MVNRLYSYCIIFVILLLMTGMAKATLIDTGKITAPVDTVVSGKVTVKQEASIDLGNKQTNSKLSKQETNSQQSSNQDSSQSDQASNQQPPPKQDTGQKEESNEQPLDQGESQQNNQPTQDKHEERDEDMGEDTQPEREGTNSVSGFKFGDANANGVWDEGEFGLEGWRMTISGPVVATAVTDEGGKYKIENLPNGFYVLCEEMKDGWEQTFPQTETECDDGTKGYEGDLVGNEHAEGVDFGNRMIEKEAEKPEQSDNKNDETTNEQDNNPNGNDNENQNLIVRATTNVKVIIMKAIGIFS